MTAKRERNKRGNKGTRMAREVLTKVRRSKKVQRRVHIRSKRFIKFKGGKRWVKREVKKKEIRVPERKRKGEQRKVRRKVSKNVRRW